MSLRLAYSDQTRTLDEHWRLREARDRGRCQKIAPAMVAPQAASARMQFTITVDDVDATTALLAGRGVALLIGPMDRPWGIRTASFTDPAGHLWEIAS